MKTAELYETDFAEWAMQNAELLRSGRISDADLEHIAEEIEDLAKREHHALQSRFMRLMEHLLKWRNQPERRGSSWMRSIVVNRQGIRELLKENPSFRPSLPQVVAEAYEDAARLAAVVLKCGRTDFPKDCPFTLEQLLDDDFLP